MESILGGFQLPFQRRLTKMYSETKNSYDFVKGPPPVAENPDLHLLHRKLRIQKDRLVSWGLGWSESSQSPDIDESLSKVGLGDLVGSIMSTIQEILAEVEPLWQSSRRGSDARRGSPEKSGDHKVPLVTWDRSRFEDLIRDLTSSIDTLYDLSRSRQTARQSPLDKQQSSTTTRPNSEEGKERLFDSTRVNTPQQIDPSTLVEPNDTKFEDGSSLWATFAPSTSNSRQIVYMNSSLSSTSQRWKRDTPPPKVPILLEYAAYDPIYSNTGIAPSLTRFEKLFAGLQIGRDIDRPDFGVLNLIGYFEDSAHSRYGLLYELPIRFGPMSGEPRIGSTPYMVTLSDMLSNQIYEPPLEVKYRLAYSLASSIFDMHSKGIVHGNLAAVNIAFFEQPSPDSVTDDPFSTVNVRRPFLTSFDLFPDAATQQVTNLTDETSWYRHSLDPRLTPHTVLTTESRSLDVYSLAMLLLQIGLWSHSRDIISENSGIPIEPRTTYKQIAARCGTSYLRAVQACWRAIDDDMANISRPDVALQKVYGRVLNALERCCGIDDEVDEEPVDEVSFAPPLQNEWQLKSAKKPEAPSLSHSADLSKVDERDRASLVLSNVIRARDNIYKQKTRSQSPAQPGEPSGLRKNSESKLVDRFDETSKYGNIARQDMVGQLTRHREQISTNQDIARKDMVEQLSRLRKESVKTPDTVYQDIMDQLPTLKKDGNRPTYRRFPGNKIAKEHLDHWHTNLMPQINRALRGFYRKYPESVEISLESVGEVASKTKPTILVICTSVGKVKAILKKYFVYDTSKYALLVCKGKIVRSRKDRPRRSMADDMEPSNPHYQERPFNGASIGAYADGRHLLPVSFGGLIMVDGKPYGLTVHHMLDDPSDEAELEKSEAPQIPSDLQQESNSALGDDLDYQVSDGGSDTASIASSIEDDDLPEYQPGDPGDIAGIDIGCGDGYFVTQPAFDDVDESFLPSEDGREDDHLKSHTLGEVYASSGIRRRFEDGLTHEIDWALFKFAEHRLPSRNYIQDGEQHCRIKSPYPVDVVPWSSLSGLDVHCMARTSGLQTGRILPGMTVVKIFGRQTPSSSYQVSGKLGVPGDSGAWVIENEHGRACGHVLAWSSRKKVAYICPMDIILADIAETLEAETVCFPDSAVTHSESIPEHVVVEDNITTGQESLLNNNPPAPLLSQPIQVLNIRPVMPPAWAPEDDLVVAMQSMHVSPSVVT